MSKKCAVILLVLSILDLGFAIASLIRDKKDRDDLCEDYLVDEA